MTVIINCINCGEKNDFTNIVWKLLQQGLNIESKTDEIKEAINKLRPRCKNCQIKMIFPQQISPNVREN